MAGARCVSGGRNAWQPSSRSSAAHRSDDRCVAPDGVRSNNLADWPSIVVLPSGLEFLTPRRASAPYRPPPGQDPPRSRSRASRAQVSPQSRYTPTVVGQSCRRAPRLNAAGGRPAGAVATVILSSRWVCFALNALVSDWVFYRQPRGLCARRGRSWVAPQSPRRDRRLPPWQGGGPSISSVSMIQTIEKKLAPSRRSDSLQPTAAPFTPSLLCRFGIAAGRPQESGTR